MPDVNLDTLGLETVACLCGSTTATERIEAQDDHGSERFTYVVCPACSLERLSPRPTLERIGAYYPQTYKVHVGAAPQGRADRLKRLVYEVFWAPEDQLRPGLAAWRPLLRTLLWPVRMRTIVSFPAPARRRVFEFGAAKATDLLAFQAAGWQAEGCEPSAQACAVAASQGIVLQNATAETAVLEDGAYSCILFNNVFEHLHSPKEVLALCHRALEPGGVLLLIVPNHACWTRHLAGAAWPGYDAPRHTWGWTPRAFRRHLAEAGFTIDGIHHQATGAWLWRSVLDMRHAPGRPGPVRLWAARNLAALGVPLGLLAALCGAGDFIRVVARRT